MKRNTKELWDKIWKNERSIEEDIFNLLSEENGIRWQRIEDIVIKRFGTFNNLEVIEIGAGSGTNAALMAKRGSKVTILDYSDNALKRSQTFFNRNKFQTEFIKQDVLSLSTYLYNKYDISMSFGLAEHFRGSNRAKVIKAHFNILKQGGIAIISVPNRNNIPYRIYKLACEITNKWTVGEEYPFSRDEIRSICRYIGIKDYFFFGDYFFQSFNFINPFILAKVRKIFGLKNLIDLKRIKKQKGSFLDQYISYSLVICLKK